MSTPLFFTFDGVDGAGKSTQMRLFVEWLRSHSRTVVTCRDPGTTVVGEQLRSIVLDPANKEIGQRSEALIYMSARAQLVHEIIRPALAQGHVVVSDRFLLATVVYQGYGLGLDVDSLWQVGEFATGGLFPAKTIVLDLDVATAATRRTGTADRIEQRDAEYFQRLRDGFHAEAQRFPERITIVDASGSVEEIQQAVRASVSECLW